MKNKSKKFLTPAGWQAVFAVVLGLVMVIAIGVMLKNHYDNKYHKQVALPMQTMVAVVDKVMAENEQDKDIAALNSAITASPANPDLYLNRGNAYLVKGNIIMGSEDLDRAASLNPKYEPLAKRISQMRGVLAERGIYSIGENDMKAYLADARKQYDVRKALEAEIAKKKNANADK